ncbi:hypothetical protein [Streptomyces sp. bgisy022]|uniref:hypothetical protein n=1 Tax=Streptomyces sp. bgisy022 TaxID=3413769 RepID=UPI003D739235
MPTSTTVRATVPPTVWLMRGRHPGTAPEDDLRATLRARKDSRDIDDYLELPPDDGEAPDLVFEARTRVADGVVVRARLELAPATEDGRDWTLVAEADGRPWDPAWPAPTGMFWPQEPDPAWAADPATGLRPGTLHPLPEDDKAVRRLLRDCARSGTRVHVLVHEAMTTDDRGRVPLAHWLPPGLRPLVVEHRAAPHQLRVVNWALRESGVEVPRGGALVLPGRPAPEGYDAAAFSVRAVFLDGTEPVDLTGAVRAYAALPRPVPEAAEGALTALREDWHLLSVEEELARQRALVAMYAEALEAMTASRDLYREAAERAHEALAAYRESAGDLPVGGQPPGPSAPASPLRQLTRTLDRFRPTAGLRRSGAAPEPDGRSASSGS